MTAAPESPESALVAVLAEDRGWQVVRESAVRAPSAFVVDVLVDYAEQRSAEAAAILAATPTAARIEADGLTEALAEVEHWKAHAEEAGRGFGEVCRTYARVAARNSVLVDRIAQLEADLAAARSALGAVEALAARWESVPKPIVGWNSGLSATESGERLGAWNVLQTRARDVRAVLATPPQPAPGRTEVSGQEEAVERAALNTDRELFREDTGERAGSYYENSLHVTLEGTIGMNVGGTVYTLPIAKWHALAAEGGALKRIASVLAEWDQVSKGESPTTRRIRAAIAGDHR